MKNGLKTIKELFKGTKIFRVPMYQRAYSWGDKQLSDFIEDIKNQKLNRTYFLGTILLEKAEDENGFREIDIVDGQQRITTLVIFMKVLIDLLKKKDYDAKSLENTFIKDNGIYKLRLQQEDAEFFQTYILGDLPNSEIIQKRPSQKRLMDTKSYFDRELRSLSRDELIKVKEKINKTKLLTYSVEDSAEATLIFETTNDRGKPLTNLEKIKSFLMYKSYLASEESANISKSIYKRFSDIYDIIDSVDIDNEDNILQYHFVAYETWGIKRDYQEYIRMIKSHIHQLFLDDKDKDVVRYIENYTTKLRETFYTIYDFQHKIKSNYLREVFMLKRLGVAFYPLLIKTFQIDNSEGKKEFEDIVKLVEILSFRVLGMKAKRSSDLDSAINIMVREFKDDFKLLKLQLVEKILEYCNDAKFKDKLNSNDFYHDFPSDRIYLFWKYENHLREQKGYSPMSEEEFSTPNTRFQLTIEHIAPQDPEEDKERIVATKKCKFVDYSSDEFKEDHLHSIGNLTFDPRSANSSKGRKPIEEKNNYFRKAPFMTQNELESFLDDSTWTINSIDKRKQKIVNFALKMWNPIKIVGLESYNEYLENKEKSQKNGKPEYTEEYVKEVMGGGPYALLQELRKQLRDITSYEEKINKYFIGFKNHKYYFSVLRWRQKYIYFIILNIDKKYVIEDDNIEYYPDYKEMTIKMHSKDDIKKYLYLIKHSDRFKLK